MERYRSGHNEAVLKTVWGQPHKGSNPFLSAITPIFRDFFNNEEEQDEFKNSSRNIKIKW